MSWIIFPIITAFLYSISIYIDKYLVDKRVKDPVTIVILSGLVSAPLGVGLWIFLGFPLIPFHELLLILLSGIFLILYGVPYFIALKEEEASRITPLFQFVPIITLVFSYVFLRETISSLQLIGAFLTIFGAFFISLEKFEGNLFKPRRSLYFMILASILYAFVGILFRAVVKTSDFWVILAYQYIGIGVGGLLLLLFSPQRGQFRKQIKSFHPVLGAIFIGIGITIIAQISESYAISLVPVALVSLASGIEPFFALLLGIIISLFLPNLIKENISPKNLLVKFACMLIMFVGLYFIYK